MSICKHFKILGGISFFEFFVKTNFRNLPDIQHYLEQIFPLFLMFYQHCNQAWVNIHIDLHQYELTLWIHLLKHSQVLYRIMILRKLFFTISIKTLIGNFAWQNCCVKVGYYQKIFSIWSHFQFSKKKPNHWSSRPSTLNLK